MFSFFFVDYYFCWSPNLGQTTKRSLVVWPRFGDPFVSQNPRTDSRLCIYHLFIWSNLNYLLNFLWITLPTRLGQVLQSFCANLLHSLMWLMVSSLSAHDQHLLFCCDLSILVLIWLVLMALFWAVIIRDSTRFSFSLSLFLLFL